MRLRQYDPEKPLSYLKLIDAVLRHYGDFHRVDDIVRWAGEERLTDVTHTPEMGNAAVSLCDGGDQRVFQFKETKSRGGTLDVLFTHERLESFRAQLFFEGVWGKPGAVIYSSVRFARLVQEAVGRSNVQFDPASRQFFCHHGELLVSYTQQVELGMPSLTTSIMARRDCPAGIFATAHEPLRFSAI